MSLLRFPHAVVVSVLVVIILNLKQLFCQRRFSTRDIQVSCKTKYATTPLQQLRAPTSRDFYALWEGNQTNPASAVCEFHLQDAFNFHFPHTMQQLYRCWSLWNTNTGETGHLNNTLVFPRQNLPNNNFVRGYIATLQTAIDLQVVRRTSETVTAIPAVPPNTIDSESFFRSPDPPYFAWNQLRDAQDLRDVVASKIGMSNATSCNRDPRISILNRHGTRELINSHEIAQMAKIETVEYFDWETPFHEQVQFFRSHDIVISPHGAQLTGIPFLPDCGTVLEIFPVGYYLPHFFGSLASASQKLHGFLLVTKSGDWVSEIQVGMQNITTRNRARHRSLCLEPRRVIDAIERMKRQWKSCCESRAPFNL